MLNKLQLKIKDYLDKNGITVSELERRAGVPHAVVNIMRGRSKNPSMKVANSIAKELNCSVEELFEDRNCNNTKIENRTNSKPMQYDEELLQNSLKALTQALAEYQLSPEITDVLKCVEDIYKYTVDSPTKEVDLRFTKWLAQKTFLET